MILSHVVSNLSHLVYLIPIVKIVENNVREGCLESFSAFHFIRLLITLIIYFYYKHYDVID